MKKQFTDEEVIRILRKVESRDGRARGAGSPDSAGPRDRRHVATLN